MAHRCPTKEGLQSGHWSCLCNVEAVCWCDLCWSNDWHTMYKTVCDAIRRCSSGGRCQVGDTPYYARTTGRTRHLDGAVPLSPTRAMQRQHWSHACHSQWPTQQRPWQKCNSAKNSTEFLDYHTFKNKLDKLFKQESKNGWRKSPPPGAGLRGQVTGKDSSLSWGKKRSRSSLPWLWLQDLAETASLKKWPTWSSLVNYQQQRNSPPTGLNLNHAAPATTSTQKGSKGVSLQFTPNGCGAYRAYRAR